MPVGADWRPNLDVGNCLDVLGKHPCACRKSNPDVLVIQSAEDWAAKNTPCPLNSTR